MGSTGSIGCNALDVIEHLGPGYQIAAISAHSQADKLIAQANRHRPIAVAVSDSSKFEQVASALRPLNCAMYSGSAGVTEMACRDDIDVVLAAIVGAAGLPPVLAAVRAGKTRGAGEQGIARRSQDRYRDGRGAKRCGAADHSG